MTVIRLLCLFLLLINAAAPVFAREEETPEIVQLQQEWNEKKRRVTLSTGVEYAYAEMGNPKGEPVLYLHGLATSGRTGNLLARYLQDYHIFLPDLRGHGDSAKPEQGYGRSDFARDIIAFMDALGLEHPIIIGHSMGSGIAQRIAAHAPERVSRLILIAPSTGYTSDKKAKLFETIRQSPFPLPEPLLYTWWKDTPEIPATFLDMSREETRLFPRHGWLEIMADAEPPLPQGTCLHIPTLILWGAWDTYSPFEAQTMLLRHFDRAAFHMIPNTGHSPHYAFAKLSAMKIRHFLLEADHL